MVNSIPDKPFRPVFGEDPPVMGYRFVIERRLNAIIRRLEYGDGREFAFLFCPRGNGKTVSLNRMIRKTRASLSVVHASLKLRDLESDKACREALKSSVRVVYPVGQDNSQENSVTRKGLLITIDNAHEASPLHLGYSANSVESASFGTSVSLVLAGIPSLD